jgi:large subunit ribosomal protein L25
MSEKISLKVEPREIVGKKVKNLRAQGIIPAIVYGRHKAAKSISITLKEFDNAYRQAGTSSLIELDIAGEKINVLAHEPQYNPVTEHPIHVDFYRVRMDEKIKTEIPLQFIGESEAVSQLDGTLVTPRDNIEVECLPNDLVREMTVDLSVLKTFENQIKVNDLRPPQGIEIVTDSDEVIALVEPPRSEEELAELDKPTADEEATAVEQAAGEQEEGVESEEPKDEVAAEPKKSEEK